MQGTCERKFGVSATILHMFMVLDSVVSRLDSQRGTLEFLIRLAYTTRMVPAPYLSESAEYAMGAPLFANCQRLGTSTWFHLYQ